MIKFGVFFLVNKQTNKQKRGSLQTVEGSTDDFFSVGSSTGAVEKRVELVRSVQGRRKYLIKIRLINQVIVKKRRNYPFWLKNWVVLKVIRRVCKKCYFNFEAVKRVAIGVVKPLIWLKKDLPHQENKRIPSSIGSRAFLLRAMYNRPIRLVKYRNPFWFTNTFQINPQAKAINKQTNKTPQTYISKAWCCLDETEMNKTCRCAGRLRASIGWNVTIFTI